MNDSIRSLAIISILGSSLMCFGQTLEYRYWKALNEGRDLSALTPVLDQIVFPPLRKEPLAELRRKAAQMLDCVEESAPIPSVVNRRAENDGKPGGDWPSMGGNAMHWGMSNEPGPVCGREKWRYPVGWLWEAAPRFYRNRVLTACPAIGRVTLCLDRRTGKRLWAAEIGPPQHGRQCRAASSVMMLSEREAAVFRETFDGWPLSFVVVNLDNGQVLRRMPAGFQGRTHAPPETEPRQLVAFRFEKGTQVMVKSLLSGRTWWRFPTGFLPDEPLLAANHVFAACEDGALWALNLRGDQRVAWTYSNPAGWGSTPTQHGNFIYIGGNDGAVYAFEAQSGTLRWKTAVASPMPQARRLFATPAVAEDRIYVGAANGILYALDASSGRLAWKYDCGDWIRARPCVVGQRICAATLDGELVAVRDEQTRAAPLWTARVSRFPIYADLAADEDGVLVSTSDFDLVACRWTDGKEQWRAPLIDCRRVGGIKVFADSMPDIMQAPVIVADGLVLFAGRNGFVVACDAAAGRRRWRFECGGRVSGAPTTRDGRVFVGQVAGNQKLYALDLRTGKPLWSRALGEVWASPECDGRDLFVGSKDGVLHCLDPATGRTRWKRTFADGVYPAPAVNAKRVYTGSWDGHYYALDRKDGRVVWAFSRPGYPYHLGYRPDSAAPVVVDNKVLVPILGGRFAALDAHTGRLLWESKGTPWRICNVTAAADGRTVIISHFGNAYEFPFGAFLVGLDIETGRELWRIPGPGGLTAPVITAGRRFLVGSLNSPFLYGYQMDERLDRAPRLLWRLRTGGVMCESLPAVSGSLAFFLSNDGWLRAVE